MRSVSQASNLFTNALGSWLTIPLTILVNVNSNHPWVADNVDDGHLDYYFFLLAGLMFLAEVGFAYMSHGYQYVDIATLNALSASPGGDEDQSDSKRCISVDSTSGGGVVGIVGDVISSNTAAGGVRRRSNKSVDSDREPLLG